MRRLSTPRTILRPLEVTDARATFAWFSDPEVMRYIPSAPDATIQQTAERLARYREHERQHGFSKWLITDASTGQPIGDSGFYTLPGDRVELGYRLRREAWGRGLATEVASAWLEVAPAWYGFREVFAFAHRDNAASLHVMKKLGFAYSHEEEFYGMTAPLYRIILPSVSHSPISSPAAMALPALHIPAGSGPTFNLLGLETTVKVTAADSGGAYILSEQVIPPGMGVPPHVHTQEDEVFFVLEGEIEFLVGDKTVIGRAGDILHAPRHVPHAYKGAGVTPSRARFMAMPGDIEAMFAQLASWPSNEPPDLAKLAELCGKYGISFV